MGAGQASIICSGETTLDIQKKIMGMIQFSFFVVMMVAMASGNAWAAPKPAEIAVLGGNTGRGGNHRGSFEAYYEGKKIEVIYSYNATRGKPMEHPVKVYQGDKKISEWKGYLQQKDTQQLPIKGREITLMGKWKDQKTFEAYKIYLPADIRKIGEK